MDISIVDPEDLRHFCNMLLQIRNSMLDEFEQTHKDMHRVNEIWNDEKNRQFMEEFEIKYQKVKQTADLMENYAGYINKVYEAVQNYINQR